MMNMNMNGTEVRNGHDNPQDGPFGYSFPLDTPYEPAPASPPGPALLDDNESNMLDTFFTTINSNPFTNDFWLPSTQNDQNKSLHPAAGFDWSAELPPTFEGSTTSLSQPLVSHRSHEKPIGILADHSNSTSDIVAAASMLYQNGVNGHEISTSFGSQPLPTFSNLEFPPPKGGGKDRPRNGQLPAKRASTSSQPLLPVGFHTSKMFFDVHEPISPEQQASTKGRPLHWGSDSSFMDQGYVRPPDQPDEEQRTKELLGNLECLEPQSSAANTRAPTPDRLVNHHPGAWAEPEAVNHLNGLRKDYGNNTEDFSHPKKKQKTLVKEEDEETSDGDSSRQQSRRSMGASRRMSNDAIRKSRASQSTKPPRENLTEEQKRNNHILSEQKRRNLIRQGFDDLCTLVPGLKGGGFSKSAMLTQSADWLEELLQGNEALKAQLADLKAMNGLVMPR